MEKNMDEGIAKWTLEYFEEHTQECKEAVAKPDFFDKVPILTKENFPSFKEGDFVRYQGFVQDFLYTEDYVADSYVRNARTQEKSVKSGKYREHPVYEPGEDIYFSNVVDDGRIGFYFVPVPCTNNWVHDFYQKQIGEQSSGLGPATNKGPGGSCDNDIPTGSGLTRDRGTNTEDNSASREMQLLQSQRQAIRAYFPVPDERNDLACIVKVYEELDMEGGNENQISINEKVEVIGFLCLKRDQTANISAVIVPRIHVLRYRKLVHYNPLISQTVNTSEIATIAEESRRFLLVALTHFFGGDSLAAEYVICYLMSKVYFRYRFQTFGNMSLNLFNVQMENYARRFYEILETLVTNSQYMPLTNEFLNKTILVPRKDNEDRRLCSGRLQLANDTHLILDETQMNKGGLTLVGSINVSALQTLVRDQEIYYQSRYHAMDHFTSFPVLVFSKGKSTFQTRFHLKLEMEPSTTESLDETFDIVLDFLSGEVSDKIRKYLTCMRLQEFKMSEELQPKAEEEFARPRITGNNSPEMQTLAALSRFLAASHGRASLDVDDWYRAVEMEEERKARLKKM